MIYNRHNVLKFFYSISSFDIRGDIEMSQQNCCDISCIIPTFDRWKDLDVLLDCLSCQNMKNILSEVIVIEDGMSDEGLSLCSKYESKLNIILCQSDSLRHSVGLLRNKALLECRGRYILFLDDDTRILDNDFLEKLFYRFESLPSIDCIQISGKSDRSLIKNKYSYLDEFSFATRCVSYRRESIALIGGFIDSLNSYEDIELSIRFILSGGKVYKENLITYYHPPLYFHSWSKAISNGLSFFTLRTRYSFLLWLICYINALRYLLLLLSPITKHRQWGMISAGFLAAPMYYIFKVKNIIYR